MNSMKQLMKDLGWDEKNTSGTARAFLKNLVKAADESNRPIPLKQKPWAPQIPRKNEQLSFDLEGIGSIDNPDASKVKKTS